MIFININLILKKYFTLQLNPFSEGMYKVLNDVFEEYLGIFHYDAFHVGGDEVSVPTFAVNIRYICLDVFLRTNRLRIQRLIGIIKKFSG